MSSAEASVDAGGNQVLPQSGSLPTQPDVRPSYSFVPDGDVSARVGYIRGFKVAGLDTEFYGVDIRSQSPVSRSKCHVWSVAVPSGRETALGYNHTESFVFTADALASPEVKAWLEDTDFTKAVHNQPVDSHTLGNAGICLRGGVNTLDLARWVYPHLARGFAQPFALGNLAHSLAGLNKTEDYKDLFAYDARKAFEVETTKKRCQCGELSCRKKTGDHVRKWPERVTSTVYRKVTEFTPLTDLHPAHPLWPRYIAYAARDAELALIVYQIMLREGEKSRPWPW